MIPDSLSLLETATPTIPRHVAIIMDGNARWAKARGKSVSYGHKHGAEALRNILKPCADMGIAVLSVYAFSSENWSRPQDEVSDLMLLLDMYLRKELKTLVKNDIRLHVSGDISRLPASTVKQIEKAEATTKDNTTLTLNICLSYGARQEITEACRTLAQQCVSSQLSPDAITEETIQQQLYTAQLPDPDLLIRTGGDMRISNFLLWQCAYAELYFTDTLWPDFDAQALQQACTAYSERERRYGKR